MKTEFFTRLFFHLIIVLQPKYFQIKVSFFHALYEMEEVEIEDAREVLEKWFYRRKSWFHWTCIEYLRCAKHFVKGCDAKMRPRLIHSMINLCIQSTFIQHCLNYSNKYLKTVILQQLKIEKRIIVCFVIWSHKLLCYLILFTFLVLNQRFKLLAVGILGIQLGESYHTCYYKAH